MTLKLVAIGAMGLMLSPTAKHLLNSNLAQFIRVHDRGQHDPRRDQCRENWRQHGAELVNDFASLVDDGRFDGVVICTGKNGDDLKILQQLLALLDKSANKPFILHLSTVSSGFVSAAYQAAKALEIDYINYPLTGGPLGAETANMLILASGNKHLFERLQPTLASIGKPRYFGESMTAAAEVKLMGQLMVFNGLIGISSAAALRSACFSEPLTGSDAADFFQFLNAGAGGTRQWDVALSKGVGDDIWSQGFMIQHAAVDAIYAAQLCLQKGLASISVAPMIFIALAFTYLLNKYPGQSLATHAIARELLDANAQDIDRFVNQNINLNALQQSIENCIKLMPEDIQASVKLDIKLEDFSV